jgi:hypothetical protein
MVSDETMDDGKVSGDGDTADDVAWSKVIEAKYYYAGGSARFMFDCRLSELKSVQDNICCEVWCDDWKYFAQGRVFPSTPTAVNYLMQQFEGNAFPVSKCILFRAYEKCRTELVESVKKTAVKIPALIAWAFELEQIDLVRLSHQSNPENLPYFSHSCAPPMYKSFWEGGTET